MPSVLFTYDEMPQVAFSSLSELHCLRSYVATYDFRSETLCIWRRNNRDSSEYWSGGMRTGAGIAFSSPTRSPPPVSRGVTEDEQLPLENTIFKTYAGIKSLQFVPSCGLFDTFFYRTQDHRVLYVNPANSVCFSVASFPDAVYLRQVATHHLLCASGRGLYTYDVITGSKTWYDCKKVQVSRLRYDIAAEQPEEEPLIKQPERRQRRQAPTRAAAELAVEAAFPELQEAARSHRQAQRRSAGQGAGLQDHTAAEEGEPSSEIDRELCKHCNTSSPLLYDHPYARWTHQHLYIMEWTGTQLEGLVVFDNRTRKAVAVDALTPGTVSFHVYQFGSEEIILMLTARGTLYIYSLTKKKLYKRVYIRFHTSADGKHALDPAEVVKQELPAGLASQGDTPTSVTTRPHQSTRISLAYALWTRAGLSFILISREKTPWIADIPITPGKTCSLDVVEARRYAGKFISHLSNHRSGVLSDNNGRLVIYPTGVSFSIAPVRRPGLTNPASISSPSASSKTVLTTAIFLLKHLHSCLAEDAPEARAQPVRQYYLQIPLMVCYSEGVLLFTHIMAGLTVEYPVPTFNGVYAMFALFDSLFFAFATTDSRVVLLKLDPLFFRPPIQGAEVFLDSEAVAVFPTFAGCLRLTVTCSSNSVCSYCVFLSHRSGQSRAMDQTGSSVPEDLSVYRSAKGFAVEQAFSLTTEERPLCVLPLHHINPNLYLAVYSSENSRGVPTDGPRADASSEKREEPAEASLQISGSLRTGAVARIRGSSEEERSRASTARCSWTARLIALPAEDGREACCDPQPLYLEPDGQKVPIDGKSALYLNFQALYSFFLMEDSMLGVVLKMKCSREPYSLLGESSADLLGFLCNSGLGYTAAVSERSWPGPGAVGDSSSAFAAPNQELVMGECFRFLRSLERRAALRAPSRGEHGDSGQKRRRRGPGALERQEQGSLHLWALLDFDQRRPSPSLRRSFSGRRLDGPRRLFDAPSQDFGPAMVQPISTEPEGRRRRSSFDSLDLVKPQELPPQAQDSEKARRGAWLPSSDDAVILGINGARDARGAQDALGLSDSAPWANLGQGAFCARDPISLVAFLPSRSALPPCMRVSLRELRVMDASLFAGRNGAWKRSFEASRQSEALGQQKSLVVYAARLNESVLEKSSVRVIRGLPGLVFNATRNLKRVDYYLAVTCASLLRIRGRKRVNAPGVSGAVDESGVPGSPDTQDTPAHPGSARQKVGVPQGGSGESAAIPAPRGQEGENSPADAGGDHPEELSSSSNSFAADLAVILGHAKVRDALGTSGSERPGASEVVEKLCGPEQRERLEVPEGPGRPESPATAFRATPDQSACGREITGQSGPALAVGSEIIQASMQETEATTARLSAHMGYPAIETFIYQQLAFYRPYEAYAVTTYHMKQLVGILIPVLRIIGMTYRLPRSDVEFPAFCDEKEIEPMGRLVEGFSLLLHSPTVRFYLSQAEKPYRYALLEGFCTYYYSSCMEVDDDVFTLSSLHLLCLVAIVVQIYDFRRDSTKAHRSVATQSVKGHSFQISVFSPSSTRMFHKVPTKVIAELVSAVEEVICIQLRRHNVSLELIYHFYKSSIWYSKYSATTLLRLQAREVQKMQTGFIAAWGRLFGIRPGLDAPGSGTGDESPGHGQPPEHVPAPFDFQAVTANLPEMLSTPYGRRLDSTDDIVHIFLRLMPWALSFREILFPSAKTLLQHHRDICAIAVILVELYAPHISLFRKGLRDLSMFPAPLKNISVIYQYITGTLRQFFHQFRALSTITREDLLGLMEDSFEHHLDDAEVDRVEREAREASEAGEAGQTKGLQPSSDEAEEPGNGARPGWLHGLSKEEQDQSISLFLQSFYESLGLLLTSVARNLPDLAGIGFQPLDGEPQAMSIAELLLRTLHLHSYSLQRSRGSFAVLQLATHYATCRSLSRHVAGAVTLEASYLDLQGVIRFCSLVSSRAPALMGELLSGLLENAVTVLQAMGSRAQAETPRDVRVVTGGAGRMPAGQRRLSLGRPEPGVQPRRTSLPGPRSRGASGREDGVALEEVELDVTVPSFLSALYRPCDAQQVLRFVEMLCAKSPEACLLQHGGRSYIVYSLRSPKIAVRGLDPPRAPGPTQDRVLQLPEMSVAESADQAPRERKLQRAPSWFRPGANFVFPLQVGSKWVLYVYSACVSHVFIFSLLGYSSMECVGHQPLPISFPRAVDPAEKPYVCCRFCAGEKKGTAQFEFYYSSTPSGTWSAPRADLPRAFPRYEVAFKGRNKCRASTTGATGSGSKMVIRFVVETK